MKFNTVFGLAILVYALLSCSKDEDTNTVPPSFTATYINQTQIDPSETQHLEYGDSLNVSVDVEGKSTLSELQFEIHPAFDAHEHERLSNLNESIGTDTLRTHPEIITLTGMQSSLDVYSEKLDTNLVSGVYHIELILLDVDGNRTEQIVQFEIEGHHEEEHDDHEGHEEHDDH